MSARYVLLYEPADDVAETAPQHFAAHTEHFQAFHAAGTLLSIGTFAEPGAHAAMAIFTSREAADEFVEGDPFVLNGVVARHEIREWDDVLA